MGLTDSLTTGGATIGSLVPGVGTALGATIGGFIGSLVSLFDGGNPQADAITQKFVEYSANNGIFLNQNDVVHLLPANWGNPDNINYTAKVFDSYIQSIKNNTFSLNSFGGGYKPNHIITYDSTKDLNFNSASASSTSKFNLAGIFQNPFVVILLLGAGIFLISKGRSL